MTALVSESRSGCGLLVAVLRCSRVAGFECSLRRQEKGNQAILAPRQPIGRMTGDLQQELSVSAFVQQDTIGWLLDRQAAKNKGPGGEAQGLAGGISLQPDALDGFGLTKLLLGYEDLAR